MDKKDFGLNLEKHRLAKKMSAYELGLQIGKHTTYIRKVEKGITGMSLDAIFDVCDVLDIEPKNLFDC